MHLCYSRNIVVFVKKKSIFLAVALLFLPASAIAQTYSSSSYQVNEATFGSGGDVDANSASYNARGSVGNLGVGESTSASYAAFAGSVTPDREYLELNVTAGNVDLGTLTTTTTGIGTGTFYVRTYLNSAYVVKTLSQPLSNGTEVIDGMSTAGSSTQGIEQFGINLVANTAPTNTSFPSGAGSAASQIPSSTFANGQAATGYDTANTYKYVVGDTIASSSSARAWGQTNYTITYIANVSGITPGGQYTANHDIAVMATY